MMSDDTCGKTSLSVLVSRVSGLLNDEGVGKKAEVWGRSKITDYLNEALCVLHGARPDAFTKTVDIELSAGSKQTLPSCYSALVSMEYSLTTTKDGAVVEGPDIQKEDSRLHNLSNSLDRKSEDCGVSKGKDFFVSGYAYNPSVPDRFSVFPAVPAGKTSRVCARVVEHPTMMDANREDEVSSVPCKFDAALVNWAMHRAFSVDIESQFSAGRADKYHDAFYRVLNLGYQMESRFHSGYYLGQMGDEDKSPDSKVS